MGFDSETDALDWLREGFDPDPPIARTATRGVAVVKTLIYGSQNLLVTDAVAYVSLD